MSRSPLVLPEVAALPAGGLTRSGFILRTALAAAAAYGMGAVTPVVSHALSGGDSSDVDVLKVALELEYLEAAFYKNGVDQVKGLRGEDLDLARRLRDDESEHVAAIIAAIDRAGGTPLQPLRMDFTKAYTSPAAFLKTASVLEEIGVSAYNGAALQISSAQTLGFAGSIAQIEARHAALIRVARDAEPAPVAFDHGRTTSEVLEALKPYIDV